MRYFAPFAALALAGCITVYPPDAPSDGSAYVRFGETASLGRVKVTPLTLIEDSRCPQGVQCVWAGRVRITATISTPTAKISRELTLGEPAGFAGGALVLAEVRPVRGKDTPLALGDYRFGFTYR